MSQYDPKSIEKQIFSAWQKGGYFKQNPGTGKSYVITIPPPNVTGSLHMGHALNNTIQDVLIRKNRMAGRPTRWVTGTDHAGIATQNKVEQKLAKEGLTRFDIGREAFIDKCWEWRAEHGNQIINQLKAMGCSCDYDDEWFTMDPSYQQAVRKVFVDWYNDGLIYRGNRIINWCPRCTTALSDIEVEHEDRDGKLYHIRYPVLNRGECASEAFISHSRDFARHATNENHIYESSTAQNGAEASVSEAEDVQYITIATTRPETMLGDVAVAVHPEDARYASLIGASVRLPLMDRFIPIIADDYVDPEFGTGALKITPAHDANDFEVGQRHNLPQPNIFNEEAVVTAEGGIYEGLSREGAREKIVADLQAGGYLVEIEDHPHSVGVCYRCATAIEPWLSEQWFVDMKPLAEPAIKVVRDEQVKFHPKRWENVYFHWMENIRDWCISRQLWWGHRIPVFYCDSCDWMVASEEDLTACSECAAAVRQDEDVLDTWFSSQIWPFAVLGWPSEGAVHASEPSVLRSREQARVAPHESLSYAPSIPQNNEQAGHASELARNYPTNTLSTAPDILFLWVARMIMSGLYFVDDIPFEDVIIHPTVFNKEGRRMSKSLGTGVDPLDLMEHYGADGMRFGLMLQVTGVQDMKFDEEKLLSSRNFANKIWNAARFVLLHTEDYKGADQRDGQAPPQSEALADRWILSRLAYLTDKVSTGIDSFEFGEVSRELYSFFWSEFCDWYIELAKSRLNGSPEERASVQAVLVFVLDNALRLLHPMMPYISEEIWQKLPANSAVSGATNGANGASLIVASWPDAADFAELRDAEAERRIELLKAIVTAARSTRARYGLSPKEVLTAVVNTSDAETADTLAELASMISSVAKLNSLDAGVGRAKPANASATVAAGLEVYIPLEGLVDFEAEAARLRKEHDKVAKDLARLDKKLANEGFLAKAAPEIIEKDRAKAADLREALAQLTAQLEA